MARKARVEFPGAIYHVLDRGDRREAIFLDGWDRERFLEMVGEVCARTGWRVHAFVLMSNHYHLFIETPQANLVAGMRWCHASRRVTTANSHWPRSSANGRWSPTPGSHGNCTSATSAG
jgi:putative transposase